MGATKSCYTPRNELTPTEAKGLDLEAQKSLQS